MPTCRQVSRLQSDALDQPLSLPKRFGLRLHLLVCKWCRRYGNRFVSCARPRTSILTKLTEAAPRTLSPEARERLKRSLAQRDEIIRLVPL